jgi:alkanesulfonate monooxygenase SsuD/methylene tetrahydromethanopterin reductase-like flavin-dependent oxidoreductase (luciferase family)
MKAEEIRGRQEKIEIAAAAIGAREGDFDSLSGVCFWLAENAAQAAEVSESLKRLAYPLLTVPNKTLRDEFAMAALTAIIGRGDLDTEMNVLPYCQDAYTIADAMIEARSNKEGKCS